MKEEVSADLVRQICLIHTSDDLTAWKQDHKITIDLIHNVMTEVRRLLEIAEFEPAGRLSEWCMLLVEELPDPGLRARAMVTRGIALARVDEHAKAVTYYDEALRIYEEAGEELMAAKARQNR